MIEILSVLCAPRRQEILRQVWNNEQTAGEIGRANGDITFGAVSQHLRILQAAGLVDCRKEGQHRYYRARKEEFGPLQQWLESMWDAALYRLKIRAEIEQARRGPQKKTNRRKRKNA